MEFKNEVKNDNFVPYLKELKFQEKFTFKNCYFINYKKIKKFS